MTNNYLIIIDKKYNNLKILLNNLNNIKKNDETVNYEIRTFTDLLGELTQTKSIILKKYNKIVFVTDDGILPFMYFNKIKNVIAASVYDEHSAYMTPFHNNTQILATGYEICSVQLITRIIYIFLQIKFEGGRHYSRIDMLNTMLEDE